MFSLQSIFTTARPPLSSCFTIGPSRASFSIRSLTSCREMGPQMVVSVEGSRALEDHHPGRAATASGVLSGAEAGLRAGQLNFRLPHPREVTFPWEWPCLLLTAERPTQSVSTTER